MFNNSSDSPFAPGGTSPFGKFDGQESCLLRHLQNTTLFQGYAQAQEACSMYANTEELGTATAVISWLLGLLIITTNASVIWGIIRTRELHKALYFYMANLAVADLVGGIGLLYRTVDQVDLMKMYRMMNIVTFLIYSQVMSASALSLLSVYSYVAVRHHVYFHNHASTAKRDAVLAIAFSWLVLSLVVFLPSMGWNCLDTLTTNCLMFYHVVFVGLVAIIVIVLISTILFTNISVLLGLKQRQKRRFGPQPQDNNQGQNGTAQVQPRNVAQDEARRKLQRSVQKARTVLIYVVVAFISWLLPLVLIPICLSFEDGCPSIFGPNARAVLITVNSAINPIASIIRTPDLRKGIWQTVVDIRRVIRGNRVNPQGEQPGPGNAPDLPRGAARATEPSRPTNRQNSSTAGHSKSLVNKGMVGPKAAFSTRENNDIAIVEI